MTETRLDHLDLWFLPDRHIVVPLSRRLRIKGASAGPTNGVHFAEVYAAAPELSLDEASAEIDRFFSGAVMPGSPMRRLVALCGVRPSGSSRRVGPWDTAAGAGWGDSLRHPYRIADCSSAKVANSLQWIHTNLSKEVGDAANVASEDLFRAFATLLKADDHWLARKLTPNGSIALQEGLKHAVLPGYADHTIRRSLRSVNEALRLLALTGPIDDLLVLCELSTFAGIVWFGRSGGHGESVRDLDEGTRKLQRAHSWGIDHRTEFVARVLEATALVLVLDDCGEAVFDVALLFALMRRNRFLHARVLARARPDGANVTAADVLRIAHSPALRTDDDVLRRLRVTPVDQPFPSFESAYLPRRVHEHVDKADVVLVKGAGFFETALFARDAYYSFVVHGESSRLLTGLERGVGVFRRVECPNAVHDLRDSVSSR